MIQKQKELEERVKLLQREWTSVSMLSRALNSFLPSRDKPPQLDDAVLGYFNDFSLLGSGCNGAVLRSGCSHPEVVSHWEQFSISQEQRIVALKMIYNFAQQTKKVGDHFQNEYIVLQRLEPHPNIVTLLNHFVAHPSQQLISLIPEDLHEVVIQLNPATRRMEARGTLFVVMEYHSQTLRNKFRREGRFSVQQTLSILTQICSGLLHLYRNKVLHLDIKLDNILVSSSGRIVLIDFGEALFMEIQNNEEHFVKFDCDNSRVGGNSEHLSPELLTAREQLSIQNPQVVQASKQPCWELGVLLWELWTGKHPYEAYPLPYTHNRSVSVDNKTLEQARRELTGLPEELIQLATNLVANNPQTRPSLETAHKLLWSLFSNV
jgi:serine/threonine protein kinase